LHTRREHAARPVDPEGFARGVLPAVSIELAGGHTRAARSGGGQRHHRKLLIPGATCKVIIIQGVERRGEIPGFLAFARTGIPATGINPFLYALD
jgi:hypothetical protein